VSELLDEGINVITAVNVQHPNRSTTIIQRTLGVTVREDEPRWVVFVRETRSSTSTLLSGTCASDSKKGKIYAQERFNPRSRIPLKEGELTTAPASSRSRSGPDRAIVCARKSFGAKRRVHPGTEDGRRVLVLQMSSDPPSRRCCRRKASESRPAQLGLVWRLVQTPDESADEDRATVQRKLSDNFQLAQDEAPRS